MSRVNTEETILRPALRADLDAVRAINQTAVPHVNSVSLKELKDLADMSTYFRVIDSGTAVVAFLIGLRPGTVYASQNYRWFCQRYPDFMYIDRIAVAASHRRQGLALRLYSDIESCTTAPLLTCEVNIEPPNVQSRDFHQRYGFNEVGQQEVDGGAKTVSLMAKVVGDVLAPSAG